MSCVIGDVLILFIICVFLCRYYMLFPTLLLSPDIHRQGHRFQWDRLSGYTIPRLLRWYIQFVEINLPENWNINIEHN